jgi:hypothetical protein
LFKKINRLSLSDSKSEISKSFDSENSSSDKTDSENLDSENTYSEHSTPDNTSSESEYSVSSNSEKLSNRNRAKIQKNIKLNSKSTVIESSDSDQKFSASDLEKLKKKKKVSVKI